MAKFLDKKERVIDFQLTPYGKQRLSAGKLKPTSYAFFDDGIIYDSEYAGFSESQNDIHKRIKQETQFIEGILRFEEIETSEPPPTYLEPTLADTLILASDIDISPTKSTLMTNKYSFESAIGDAAFEGRNTQAAPAWKIVACQGEITKATTKDSTNYNFTSASLDVESKEFDIPQIDVVLRYSKVAGAPEAFANPETVSDITSQTARFVDGNVIKLVRNDLVIYAEEQNTQLLVDNFDIEVFEILTASVSIPSPAGSGASTSITKISTLERKFFQREVEQVVDGIMKMENPNIKKLTALDKSSVEYYFDVLKDSEVNDKIACQCASSFNRSSYYIDLDYDCEKEQEVQVYDIYGSATVPEICVVDIPDSVPDEDCDD